MMELRWLTRRAITDIPGVGRFEKVLQYRETLKWRVCLRRKKHAWKDVPHIGINDEISG